MNSCQQEPAEIHCQDERVEPEQEYYYQVNASNLPLPFDIIPEHVTNLKECAAHQIRTLLAREEDDPASLTRTDEDCLDDGFCLCDLAVPLRKLQAWRHMFPRITPFYALKCNPDPMVAAVLSQQRESGFDCASVAELELAQTSLKKQEVCYQNSSSSSSRENSNARRNFRIVYANPQRAEKDLDSALTMFDPAPPLTFDGPEELYKIHDAHQKHMERWRKKNLDNRKNPSSKPPPPPDLILRLLVPDEHSSVPLGEKFGATGDSHIAALIDTCLELELPVIGVSFHCGSGNHDPGSFATAIRLAHAALQIINEKLQAAALASSGRQHRDCWLLDIGGGYPGFDGVLGDHGRFCGTQLRRPLETPQADETETTLKIAQLVTPLVDELFPVNSNRNNKHDNMRIISEPGTCWLGGS